MSWHCEPCVVVESGPTSHVEVRKVLRISSLVLEGVGSTVEWTNSVTFDGRMDIQCNWPAEATELLQE